jgi:hypothetical protein
VALELRPNRPSTADLVAWLEQVWAGAAALLVVDGGEDQVPPARRTVRAWLDRSDDLTAMRQLSTTGQFTGDICRCLGSHTLLLVDRNSDPVGSASVHGYDRISWQRARFRNDLIIADPVGFTLLLAGSGLPSQLLQLVPRLVDALDTHEGYPQFRPAGPEHADRIPQPLRDPLSRYTGQAVADLPPDRMDAFRTEFETSCPDLQQRAAVLLEWLGHLPWPAEAWWGEGVLVRHLLDHVGVGAVNAAITGSQDLNRIVGALHWAQHARNETHLAPALIQALRQAHEGGQL